MAMELSKSEVSTEIGSGAAGVEKLLMNQIKIFNSTISQPHFEDDEDKDELIEDMENRFRVDDELLRKVKCLLGKTILSTVKCLNETIVEEYLNILERCFPIDNDDWIELTEKIKSNAGKGPKLHVKCLRGHLSSVKKPDNLKIRAFISLPSSSSDPVSRIIEGSVSGDANDGPELKFELDDWLPLPELENAVLRVEITKVKRDVGELNTRSLIGYKEISVGSIQPESYYDLSRPERGRISVTSKENVGHLVLRFEKNFDEESPNKTVPGLIAEYFHRKVMQLVSNDVDSMTNNPSPTVPTATYRVNVTQTIGELFNHQKYQPYQSLMNAHHFSPCYENESCYNIDCIIANKLEMGIEKVRKSSFTPQTLSIASMRSPSLSPSRSMQSLTSAISSSMLSLSSTSSPSESPNRKHSPKSLINKFTPSSGKGKENFTTKSLTDFFESLHSKVCGSQTLEGRNYINWNVKVILDFEGKLSPSDLRQLYTVCILRTIESSDEESWNGQFSDSVQTLLNILISFTDGSKQEIDLNISQAYLEAFNVSPFRDYILKEFILCLTESDADYSECLEGYILSRLDYLKSSLWETCDTRLQDVVNNLEILVTNSKLDVASIRNSLQATFIKRYSVIEAEQEARLYTRGGQINPLELCRDVLNNVYNEIYGINEDVQCYRGIFHGVLDFVQIRKEAFLSLCQESVARQIPENPTLPLFYSETDPKVVNLQLTFEIFEAIKRILKAVDLFQGGFPDWLLNIFAPYPEVWTKHLSIYKAESIIDNILKNIRKENMEVGSEKSLTRQMSQDPIILATLTNFLDARKGCWASRNKLGWPCPLVKLKTELLLIKAFGQLEKRILTQFELLHQEDNEYDANELSQTVKILECLIDNHFESVEEVAKLHEELAEDPELYKKDKEMVALKMAECLDLCATNKSNLREEIKKNITLYCEGRRHMIRQLVKEKKLVCVSDNIDGPDDSLMGLLDRECRTIHENRLKNESCVVVMLWKLAEDEILKKFEDRKARNLEKNKPERFSHLKPALTVMRDVKNDYFDSLGMEIDDETFTKVIKEVSVLGDTSKNLVSKLLRKQAEQTSIDLEEDRGINNNNNINLKVEDFPTVTLKFAYVSDTNSITLEIFSATGIPTKKDRSSKDVKVCGRFFPDFTGDSFVKQESRLFKDVGDSVAFDLEQDPVRFNFSLEHLASSKHLEDGFIILNLLTSYKITRLNVGEIVIQIKKNGVLMPEITNISTISDLNSDDIKRLSIKMSDYASTKSSDEYQELSRRQDDLAKSFMEPIGNTLLTLFN